MKDHAYELRTAGYTVIEGALAPERVARIALTLEDLFAEDERTWGIEQLKAWHQHGALRNLCDLDPVLADLLADSPVTPIVAELLGIRYILNCYDALALFPGQGRYPWDFHTDVMALAGTAFPAERTPGINCLYYFSDVTVDNGATWIVPASHRAVLRNPSAEALAAIAQPVVVSAGTALLFDGRLWHCAGTNSTDEVRVAVKVLFTDPWFRPQMDYTRSVRPEILQRLDAQTLRVLGFGTVPPASVRELRESLAPTADPAPVQPS